MTTARPTLHERVANVILANAHDVADARELFEALGLVETGGRKLLPVDDRPIQIGDIGKAPGGKDPNSSHPLAFAEHGRRPEGMTTPPGLVTLPPIVEKAKPGRAHRQKKAKARTKPRRVIECGTPGGYSKHQRSKEPTCAACRAAVAEYQRARTARLRAEREAS